MPQRLARVALLMAAASRALAEPITFLPCGELPASIVALAGGGDPEAFVVAAGTSVATFVNPEDPGRSALKFARDADAPRSTPLAGRAVGLAVSADGRLAFVIVRATDRKGAVRSVELARIDLQSGRASSGASLPATARGVAFGSDGATLLVAARDEIRTFQLPSLASGPLYRVPGENVGVAPLAGSSHVLVAQSSRVVRVDLAGAQGRDGLTFAEEAPSPDPLRGLTAAWDDRGPIAVGERGGRWCVAGGAPEEAAAAPLAPGDLAPDPPPAAPAIVPATVETLPPEPEPPPQQPPSPAAPPPVVGDSPGNPGEPGSVFGLIDGPSRGDVAAVVVLGPDNVLKEAARSIPDEQGRFTAHGLPAGTYRIVAAGKGGRVLICDPPFITVHVGVDGAVEAPVLKVLRAP